MEDMQATQGWLRDLQNLSLRHSNYTTSRSVNYDDTTYISLDDVAYMTSDDVMLQVMEDIQATHGRLRDLQNLSLRHSNYTTSRSVNYDDTTYISLDDVAYMTSDDVMLQVMEDIQATHGRLRDLQNLSLRHSNYTTSRSVNYDDTTYISLDDVAYMTSDDGMLQMMEGMQATHTRHGRMHGWLRDLQNLSLRHSNYTTSRSVNYDDTTYISLDDVAYMTSDDVMLQVMEGMQATHTRHGRMHGWLRDLQNLSLRHSNYTTSRSVNYDDTTYISLDDVAYMTSDDVMLQVMEGMQATHTRHGRMHGWLRDLQNLSLRHSNSTTSRSVNYDDTTYISLDDVAYMTSDDVMLQVMEGMQATHTRHGRVHGWLRDLQNLSLRHSNYTTSRSVNYDDTTYISLDDVAYMTSDDGIYSNSSDANFSTTNHTDIVHGSGIDPSVYIFGATFLIVFCTVSLAVNIVILSSVFFIRSRVYPTLYISLSLAAADTFSLFFFALGLVLFTLLPKLGIKLHAPCVMLLIEALRMGAILTTMFHLAALAVNHYLGILLPLHYNIYMARRNIQYCIVLLWTIPLVLLVLYMFVLEGDGFNTCPYEFLIKEKFRTRFSIPFFGILGMMIFIYVHIYRLVCKHQKQPFDGRCQRSFRHSQNRGACSTQVNRKAIVTTIMILGTTIIGWMPAFTYFALFCQDCLFKHFWKLGTLTELIFLIMINFLLIGKTAINSYIYAFRMKEIKVALRRMKRRLLMCLFAPHGRHSDWTTTEITRTASKHSTSRSRTLVYRMNSYNDSSNTNGTPPSYSSLRRCRSTNTSRFKHSNTSL